MSATKLGAYERRIRRVLDCSSDHAMKIAQIMRDDVLHTVALDWLDGKGFEKAAREASRLFDANRAEYERYFAAARAAFAQMPRVEPMPVVQREVKLRKTIRKFVATRPGKE